MPGNKVAELNRDFFTRTSPVSAIAQRKPRDPGCLRGKSRNGGPPHPRYGGSRESAAAPDAATIPWRCARALRRGRHCAERGASACVVRCFPESRGDGFFVWFLFVVFLVVVF